MKNTLSIGIVFKEIVWKLAFYGIYTVCQVIEEIDKMLKDKYHILIMEEKPENLEKIIEKALKILDEYIEKYEI